MKKTWNIPEMAELDIRATASGQQDLTVEDHCRDGMSLGYGTTLCS